MNRHPRRLIEVDLPIRRISVHARGADSSRLYAVYVERSNGRESRVATLTDHRAFQLAAIRANEILASNPQALPTEPIYPIRSHKYTDEKRWVDGVLARKKGLGL